MLQVEKEIMKNNDKETKILERMNFFPFTHGDTIEKQRVVLNELNKAHLAQTLRDTIKRKNDAY